MNQVQKGKRLNKRLLDSLWRGISCHRQSGVIKFVRQVSRSELSLTIANWPFIKKYRTKFPGPNSDDLETRRTISSLTSDPTRSQSKHFATESIEIGFAFAGVALHGRKGALSFRIHLPEWRSRLPQNPFHSSRFMRFLSKGSSTSRSRERIVNKDSLFRDACSLRWNIYSNWDVEGLLSRRFDYQIQPRSKILEHLLCKENELCAN